MPILLSKCSVYNLFYIWFKCRFIAVEQSNHRFDGGTGADTLGGNTGQGTFIGGSGADVFVIDVDSQTWDTGRTIQGWDNNNDTETMANQVLSLINAMLQSPEYQLM